jgi:hypothetical protein
MCGVHVERELGVDQVVGLSAALLLVHLTDGVHLVDVVVKYDHCAELTMCDLF